VSKFAKGGAIASVALGGLQLAGDAASGQGWGTKQFSADAGSTLGGIIGGIAGSFIPIPVVGTMIGGMAGSLIGGAIGGMMGSGGDEGNPASAPTTAAGGASQQGVGNKGRLSLIPPVNGPLGDRFGATSSYRTHPHRGQDWSVGEGTQVKSCAAGKVVATNTSTELGRMVQIQHEGGWITQYCHLSNNNIKTVGDTVGQGEYIANSGNTGTATTGAHLHLALMKGGKYYDPLQYMSGASGAPATPDSGSSGATGGSAGGDQGATSGDQPMPVASAGSNAVTTSTSGISGTATSIANQLGGGAGSGGEGLDKNPLLRKSSDNAYDQMTGKSGGAKNNVTINLSIGHASESEALKFAKRVKEILEDERRFASMGSN
jgi:murein DD-endopeptidase MepM/ murein hydrolase activator NlpD